MRSRSSRSDSSNSSTATAVENGSSALRVREEFFPHHLGRHGALRLIGQVIVGKDRFAFGEVLEQHAFKAIDAVASCRRDRNDRREVVPRAGARHQRQQGRLRHKIDLVQDEHDRPRDVTEKLGDVLVSAPGPGRRVEDERDDIHFAQRFNRRIDHAHVQAMERPMNPRCVYEHDLAAVSRIFVLTMVEMLDRENPIARRLGLVRNDGHLGADDPVEEGGFARVGAADERDRTGARH